MPDKDLLQIKADILEAFMDSNKAQDKPYEPFSEIKNMP
jgi:hypothetical protein